MKQVRGELVGISLREKKKIAEYKTKQKLSLLHLSGHLFEIRICRNETWLVLQLRLIFEYFSNLPPKSDLQTQATIRRISSFRLVSGGLCVEKHAQKYRR